MHDETTTTPTLRWRRRHQKWGIKRTMKGMVDMESSVFSGPFCRSVIGQAPRPVARGSSRGDGECLAHFFQSSVYLQSDAESMLVIACSCSLSCVVARRASSSSSSSSSSSCSYLPAWFSFSTAFSSSSSSSPSYHSSSASYFYSPYVFLYFFALTIAITISMRFSHTCALQLHLVKLRLLVRPHKAIAVTKQRAAHHWMRRGKIRRWV